MLNNEIDKDLKKFNALVRFMKYLSSPFCQRQANGKKLTEFSEFVLFTRDHHGISADAAKFLITLVYPYLAAKKFSVLQTHIDKLDTKNITGSLKALKKLTKKITVISSTAKWWNQNKQSQNTSKKQEEFEEETLVSSPQLKPSSQDDFIEEETLMSSAQQNSFLNEETFAGSHLCANKVVPARNKKIAKSRNNVFDDPGVETIASSRHKSLFGKFASRLSAGKVETILATNHPLQDGKLEALRTQTLVSLSHTGVVLKWFSFSQDRDLLKAKPKDFLETIRAISAHPRLETKAHKLVTQLKNALVVRKKLITEREIVINIINQGQRSYAHTLEKLSDLTSQIKINRRIRDFLKFVADEEISRHGEDFRRKLLACHNSRQLEELLSQYSLHSTSIIKKYPKLKIIPMVKKIKANYDRRPEQLVKIMNHILGSYGEVNIKEQLARLLVTTDVDAMLFKQIFKAKDLHSLMHKLQQAQQKQPAGAKKILALINTFMSPLEHVSFADFITSLNSFTPVLANKIIGIIRSEVQKEIKRHVEQKMNDNGSAKAKILGIMKILQDPRYHDYSIRVYGYSPELLASKIQSINAASGPSVETIAKHILFSSKIPKKFLQLVIESKKTKRGNAF